MQFCYRAKFTLLKFNYPSYSRVYVAIKCHNITNSLPYVASNMSAYKM